MSTSDGQCFCSQKGLETIMAKRTPEQDQHRVVILVSEYEQLKETVNKLKEKVEKIEVEVEKMKEPK
jgi:hypothetical protein